MKKSIRAAMTFAACLIVFGALTGCSKKEEEAPASSTPTGGPGQPIAAPAGNQPGSKPLQATQ